MDLVERFESRIDRSPGQGPEGDCYQWLGPFNQDGYGLLGVSKSKLRAHRLAWLLHSGSWPTMHVLHKCDNPSCVRIDHLFLGTQQDNLADMRKKLRQARGERQGMAKLSEAQVREILALNGKKSRKDIAELYGVSYEAIKGIHNRSRWKHIVIDDV